MADTLHIIVRSLGALIILFLITRILGKKQISQLTFFEYVMGITLGELAGFLSTELEGHYIHGIAAIMVWSLIPYCFEVLTLHSKRLRRLFEGRSTVVIENGKILEKNLAKERYTIDELLEQLRLKNTYRVADVEFAMLESSGQMSLLLKKEHQAITPSDLNMNTVRIQTPHSVIQDGKLIDDSLARLDVTREWVLQELDKLNLTLDQVFLAQLDSGGQLYIDLYDDQAAPIQAVAKDSLLEAMKECEAELLKYRGDKELQGNKEQYLQYAARLQQLVAALKPEGSSSNLSRQKE